MKSSHFSITTGVRCLATLLAFAALPLVQPAHASDPYAKAVVFERILNGNVGNGQSNSANALGATDGNYVSMGGPGASLIVDMGADTPVVDGPGADLEVREIGAAFGGADESYRVLVSNSANTNTFVFVGQGRALSLVDIHPAGLASARYVWIQDVATETLDSDTPGSDIDSLRSLNSSGGSDLASPSAVLARLTGQGVWLSWTPPSTKTIVTGYSIRRSLDGVTFGSSPDASLSAEETAWHDLSLPAVSNYYYAVSARAGSAESTLAVVSVPGTQMAVLTNRIVHLGDDTVGTWENPSPQRDLTLTFSLAAFADGPEAELTLDVFNVDNGLNQILLNGAKVGNVPIQSSESWASKSLRFQAGALRPGVNTLVLSSRDSSGATTGSLDDFQIRNVWLRLHGAQTNLNIITSARFMQVVPGQTNIVLRWVVEQTPWLSPSSWQTVSSPIEWTGALTLTNGFFRLRDTR